MTVLAVLPVLLTVALHRGGPWLGRRCAPRWAARSLVVSALVAAASSGLVLCAVACMGLAELPGLARLGHWSSTSLVSQMTVPLPVALAAGAVAGLLVASSLRQVARTAAGLLGVRRSAAALGPGHAGLVVVDDPATGAYAVPGLRRRGRTVVSRHLLRALTPTERRALLAHEDFHLRHRHFLYVQLAELAAAANPLLRPTLTTIRRAVEQWADDDAAAAVGDPVAVAHALAKAALVRSARPGLALAAAETEVAGRVRNLLQPTRRGTPVAVAVVACLTIGCAVSSATVAVRAHEDFERAQARYPAIGQAAGLLSGARFDDLGAWPRGN